MSKKHYEAIAKILASLRKEFGYDDQNKIILNLVSHRIADYMQNDNERFDRERFLEAAGIR